MIAFNLGYPELIVALSRPATAEDMQEIAVATLRQTRSPINPDEPELMYATVEGKNLPDRLLKAASHGVITALPGSLAGAPSPNSAFTAEVGTFLISPFGEASGTVRAYCAGGCDNVWRFVLRKQNGRWIVVSRRLELIA